MIICLPFHQSTTPSNIRSTLPVIELLIVIISCSTAHLSVWLCCSIVHWLLGQYAQLDFVAEWFKQLSYLVATHLFWTRAYRAIRMQKFTNLCLLPGLMVGLLYCTATVVLGLVMVNDYKAACLGECSFVFVCLLEMSREVIVRYVVHSLN